MNARSIRLAATAAFLATTAWAQSPPTAGPPYMALAATGGGAGFTSGGAAQGAYGAYGHVALPRIILGGQLGSTASASPDVFYGMATLGYPARVRGQSLVFPFFGVGYGVLHSGAAPRRASAVYGAGVGTEQVMDPDGFGWLVGLRGGYLFRSGDLDHRTIYVAFAVGAGGRRIVEDRPPIIIATRQRTTLPEIP